MPTVFANSRSILHAGDGNKHVAAPPDVCKTPSPGGPVPIPYPNIASDSDLADGTKKIKIEGKPAANAGSNLSTSSGDEAGTAGGGLVSSKTKGKLTWASSSPTVMLEGKGAVRFMDVTQHNGNSFNTAFNSLGGTGLAYADDFEGRCGICHKSPADHRILETPSSGRLCQRILEALRDCFARPGGVTGKERKKWKRGFMVGVMVCKHDSPQSIATTSGETPAVFTQIAKKIVNEVVLGGKAEFEDFVRVNQSGRPERQIRRNLENARDAVQQAQEDGTPGYNEMGQCAGAKLLARSKHAPLNMTEMFFRASKPWEGATYSVLVNRRVPADAWLRTVLDNAISRREPVPFTTGSVASCQTCQETLYLTNCPERTC
jgi:hypothetical protein